MADLFKTMDSVKENEPSNKTEESKVEATANQQNIKVEDKVQKQEIVEQKEESTIKKQTVINTDTVNTQNTENTITEDEVQKNK